MRVGATSWRKLDRHIKRFGKSPKRSKRRGILLYPRLKDRTVPLPSRRGGSGVHSRLYRDQCSHVSPPHDIAHINSIEEEVLQKTSLEPKDDLTPVSLSEVQLLVKSLKTRKAPGLDGVKPEFHKAPPSRPSCTPRTPTTYRARRPASSSRYKPMIPLSFTEIGIGTLPLAASRGPLTS
ncbi:hypothetical protein EVAR_69048_1 [Eumeta japonica]|uniref:Uncharacterized protein n=1 Tax=Eumeta variegata TaxID=151549 RepID=A0A4C1ZFG1_EUMVA|nr:hypothetical protein EVAR_69048_1 [Eumeta japonica]